MTMEELNQELPLTWKWCEPCKKETVQQRIAFEVVPRQPAPIGFSPVLFTQRDPVTGKMRYVTIDERGRVVPAEEMGG